MLRAGWMLRAALITCVVAGAVFMVPAVAVAQGGAETERAFAIRSPTPYNVQGDITGTGNTLLTCRAADANCEAAHAGGDFNNNQFFMEWIDVDDVGGTFNSSAATLQLPEGARVLTAWLYYGGDTAAGTLSPGPGQGAPDLGSVDEVLLRPPDAGGYQTITAEKVDFLGNSGWYGAAGDLTEIVKAAGEGEYTVANVQLGTGRSNSGLAGGWTLAVAYEDIDQPFRNLTLFDGFVNLSPVGEVRLPLAGFVTPASGPVSSRVGIVATDGDRDFNGDSARLCSVEDAPCPEDDLHVLFNGLNPGDDFFNGSLSTQSRGGDAMQFTDRRPAHLNTLGWDADFVDDRVDGTNILTNDQTSTEIVVRTTGNDGFTLNAVSIATDLRAPNVEVVKAVDKTSATLGEVLEYTVSVTNTGAEAAEETWVRDTIPEGTTYEPGSLEVLPGSVGVVGGKTDAADTDEAEFDAVGNAVNFRVGEGAGAVHGGTLGPNQSATVRFRVRVNEQGISSGDRVVNSARASFLSETLDAPGAVNSQDVVTEIVEPDLTIDKEFEGDLEPGEETPVSLTVSNVGDGPTRGEVTVTDELPPELEFAGEPPAGDGWVCTTAEQLLTCRRNDVLAAGQPWPPIRFFVRVAPNAEPREIVNTAVVSGGGDGNETNNSDTETGTTLPGRVDLAIDKQPDGQRVFPGEEVNFQLRVTNLRPVTATQVRVVDLFPRGLTPVSLVPSKGRCVLTRCRLGTVEFGEVVTIDVTAFAGLRTGGRVLENVARVRGLQQDVNPDNNEDSSTVSVDRLIDLVVDKDPAAQSVPAGSDVSYNVTVRNDGPSTATGVRLADLVPPELTFVSATPSQGSCQAGSCELGRLRRGATAQIVVVARSDPSLAGRTVENLAVASANEPELDLANNVGRAAVTFTAEPVQPADLDVSKSVQPRQVNVGGELTYRIAVTNRGPSAASSVLVTDTPDPRVAVLSVDPTQGTCSTGVPIRCELGTVAAGATATIAVRARALAAGRLRNVVTAIASNSEPDTADQLAVAAAAAQPAPRVTLRKRASRKAVRGGDAVTFILTATARGEGTARGVEVCDSLPARLTPVSLDGSRRRAGLLPLDGRRRAGRVCWRIAELEAGRSRRLRIVARADRVSRVRRVTNVASLSVAGRAPRQARARVRIFPGRPPGVTG
jgi:large repetitive protein